MYTCVRLGVGVENPPATRHCGETVGYDHGSVQRSQSCCPQVKPWSTEAHGLPGNVTESITSQGSLKNVIALQLKLHPASPAAPCIGNKLCVAPAIATAINETNSSVNSTASKQKNQNPFALTSVSLTRPAFRGT